MQDRKQQLDRKHEGNAGPSSGSSAVAQDERGEVMGKGFYVVEANPLDENRPQYYTDDRDFDNPLVIVNAEDPAWRIPPDELRAMADEVAAERGTNAHTQSNADRMKAVHERMMRHFEKKGLLARGASVNRPLYTGRH